MWTRRGVMAGTVSLSGAALLGWGSGEAATNDAVQASLRRVLGSRAGDFSFDLVADAETLPWFEVSAAADRVAVRANNRVGLMRGAYAYLSEAGALQTNWEGDRKVLPARWPEMTIARSVTPFRRRAYLNPCAFGYTTPFWDWPRWQREIDWMALHGVDMPLAMEGQEYVWHQLWSAEGVSEADLAAYFCGPAFLPWQRMGNIEGYRTLPRAWIDKKHLLQKRLLARFRDFGMEPVLPAFAGYVPKAFALRHPEARIHKMTPWGGFHETYWLDPTDPLFAGLAKRFIDLYTDAYGEGRFYLADAFNEMRPPVGDKQAEERGAILTRYGRALYDSLEAAKPGAVLAMQAWLFGIDPEFWNEASVAAFLKDMPDDKVMVLDIANDTYRGVWERTKAFSGKRWVYGYIHDFGGNNPLFGDLPMVQKDMKEIPSRQDTGRLEGFGIFPEGLNTNSIVYDFMFDRAWPAAGAPEDIDAWLAGYLKARYGKTDPNLLTAWGKLWRGAYQVANWDTGWWKGSFGCYLFCKRPDDKLAEFEHEPGDAALVCEAVAGLLAVAKNYRAEPFFCYDVVAATAHGVLLHLDRILLTMIRKAKAGQAVKSEWQKIARLARGLDDLLGAQPFGLAAWLQEAERYGDTPSEKKLYVDDAKTQVTLWGGDAVLYDYASKVWQGLVADYYLPRWARFVAAHGQARRNGGPFDQAGFGKSLLAWETAWVKNPKTYTRRVPADPIAAAKALLKELP